MNYSDEQLVNNYLKGNEKSLEIIIKNYLKPIYNFVYRYVNNLQEAEDITQEVFVRTWRNLKKFDQTRNFKTWIFSIARNASLDFLKKKKTKSFSEFSAKGGENEEGESSLAKILIDPAPSQNELFDRKITAQKVNSIMENLPVQYRTLLFMYYNDHFNFREIAEILDEPLNTVKSRYRRSLTMFRKLLSKQNLLE